MVRVFALLACLAWGQAWATTYYVRPTAQGAGDGLAYVTAASPTTIDYTVMIAGDTVKVCGNFAAANKDTRGGGVSMMYVNVSVPIIVDGDCSANGDLSQTDMNGEGTLTYGLYCDTAAACQSQTWKNVKVRNFTTRGFYIRNGTTVADAVGFVGTNLACEDIVSAAASGQWCVAGYGSGATLTNINSLRTTDDAVHWEGSNFSITDSTLRFPGYNTATGVFIGDCVQNITATDGAYIHGNYCDKRNANADGDVAKSCWVIGDPATGTSGEISDNVCYQPTTGTSTFQSKSILVSTSVSGVRILRNFVWGGYYGIFAFGGGATIAGNVVSHATAEGISVPTATASGTTVVEHNTVDHSNICYILKGASGAVTVNSYNNLAINCTTYGFEKVTATYAQSNNRCDLNTPTCSNNAGTITSVAPSLVGGDTAATPDGFCLNSDSALIGQGTYIGAYVLDFNGHAFANPPNIGALSACRGRRPAAIRRARN